MHKYDKPVDPITQKGCGLLVREALVFDGKEREGIEEDGEGFCGVLLGILQNTLRDRGYSYKNAQCFPQMNPYPLRCNKIRTLFGYIF